MVSAGNIIILWLVKIYYMCPHTFFGYIDCPFMLIITQDFQANLVNIHHKKDKE